MKVKTITAGAVQTNSYVLYNENRECIVVDSGDGIREILSYIDENLLRCDSVLLTHGHFDHITAVDALRQAMPGVPVCIHAADASMLTDGTRNASALFFGTEDTYAPADRLLQEGDSIRLGGETLTVLHTPGHSPGSVCYLDAAGGRLFTGDTLFAFGVGRCDLWGGDTTAMRQSLRRLGSLPRTLRIYPGHGESAVLGAALDRVLYDL